MFTFLAALLQCSSAMPFCNALPQCPSAMPFCNALLQCPSVVPPAVPLCSTPRRCPSAVPCRIFLLQCPSAVQRLESEKQVVLCQGEQQQQEYTLQMQCLQAACQDTLQRERAQNDEQVHLYFLHQMHAQHFFCCQGHCCCPSEA